MYKAKQKVPEEWLLANQTNTNIFIKLYNGMEWHLIPLLALPESIDNIYWPTKSGITIKSCIIIKMQPRITFDWGEMTFAMGAHEQCTLPENYNISFSQYMKLNPIIHDFTGIQIIATCGKEVKTIHSQYAHNGAADSFQYNPSINTLHRQFRSKAYDTCMEQSRD